MSILNDGSSSWPSSKDSYVDEVDDPKTGKTRMRASILNGIFKWIENSQDDLGGSLKGSKADAQARLAVRHANDGTDLDKVRVLGANNLTTLESAIDDLTSDGGKVYLPEGEETLTAECDVDSKVAVRGAGAGSVIKGTEGGHKLLNQSDSADIEKVSVDDVELDGDSPSGSAANREQYHAIDLANTNYTANDNIVGPHLWIKDVGGDGVLFRNANRNIVAGGIVDLNWQDVGANLCGRNGVAIIDGDTLIISNMIIRRAATSGIDLEPALAAELINRVVISNCIIEDCLNGITVNSTQGGLGDVEYVAINNCIIKVGDNSATGFDTGTSGIKLKYAKNVAINNCVIHGQSDISKSGTGIYIQYSDNICVNNCTVYGCLDGIKIDNLSTAPTNSLQVIGGRFYNNRQAGIYAVNGSGNEGNNVIIKGVFAYNNDQSEGGYQGISCDYFNDVIVEGCNCYDDQTGSETQNIGIHVDHATNAIILGNMAAGNTAAQIKALAANIINLEYGHNTAVITFS